MRAHSSNLIQIFSINYVCIQINYIFSSLGLTFYKKKQNFVQKLLSTASFRTLLALDCMFVACFEIEGSEPAIPVLGQPISRCLFTQTHHKGTLIYSHSK